MNAIPRKHHSFIAYGIVYSCCVLINNTCNELVIFPGIPFYSGNNSILHLGCGSYEIPYSLKFSRIKYFAVWLNSAQKQIFADKIFVVERESRKVHTYVYNKY